MLKKQTSIKNQIFLTKLRPL